MQLPKLKLSDKQIERVTHILDDIGTIIAAAAILPSLLSTLNVFHIISGLAATIILFFFAIKLSK